MKQIILKRGKSKPFFKGEPLVFSGAIQQVVGKLMVAELVEVYSSDHKLIGVGAFNPHSNYRVRLLTFAHEKLPTELNTIISYRLQQAIQKRAALHLPSEHTNVYRLFNSEADGLSGLTIDVFADYIVLSVTAYWLMLYREVVSACLKALDFKNIIWRPQEKSLAQDGWDLPSETKTPASEIITVKENDLKYQIDLYQGQKTGFYCDQRDNRVLVRSLANDKSVLDCYCYTGGFALNAALGGAKRVVGVDSSAPAIAQAQQNAALNNLNQINFQIAKAEEYLMTATGFDFIILDPPKLAPTIQSLPRARPYYLKLNQLALSILPTNGLLLTCSCSNAMDEKLFTTVIHEAAAKANKEIQILSKHGAAADHPFLPHSTYGNYLKAFLVQVLN